MKLVKPGHKILSKVDRKTILKQIELAGRVCYKSEDKITEDSASKFVKKIVEREHLSVIEHINITVKFICDRGVSHELVRHRIASYSQESTRYVNYKEGIEVIIPCWFNHLSPGIYENKLFVGSFPGKSEEKAWINILLDMEFYYKYLIKNGWNPQQARSVLPNALKTEIVMTTNLREWIHVFNMRCSKAAHPQIREIMIPLKEELHNILPEVF